MPLAAKTEGMDLVTLHLQNSNSCKSHNIALRLFLILPNAFRGQPIWKAELSVIGKEDRVGKMPLNVIRYQFLYRSMVLGRSNVVESWQKVNREPHANNAYRQDGNVHEYSLR